MQKRQSSKAPSERQLKVAETIRRIISDAFNIEKIYYGFISETSVTVTEVRISPDLKNATIFIIPFAVEAVDSVIEALNERSDIAKSYLASKAKLRFIPNLIFKYDNSFDEAKKINKIIQTITE